MPIPRHSKPGTVWCIFEEPGVETLRTYNFTGVYHSDIDCPVMRQWLDATPTGSKPHTFNDLSELASVDDVIEAFSSSPSRHLLELDKATQEGWAWVSDWEANWSRSSTLDPSVWQIDELRPCLRCGQLDGSRELTVVCSKCHLTICDCDE